MGGAAGLSWVCAQTRSKEQGGRTDGQSHLGRLGLWPPAFSPSSVGTQAGSRPWALVSWSAEPTSWCCCHRTNTGYTRREPCPAGRSFIRFGEPCAGVTGVTLRNLASGPVTSGRWLWVPGRASCTPGPQPRCSMGLACGRKTCQVREQRDRVGRGQGSGVRGHG